MSSFTVERGGGPLQPSQLCDAGDVLRYRQVHLLNGGAGGGGDGTRVGQTVSRSETVDDSIGKSHGVLGESLAPTETTSSRRYRSGQMVPPSVQWTCHGTSIIPSQAIDRYRICAVSERRSTLKCVTTAARRRRLKYSLHPRLLSYRWISSGSCEIASRIRRIPSSGLVTNVLASVSSGAAPCKTSTVTVNDCCADLTHADVQRARGFGLISGKCTRARPHGGGVLQMRLKGHVTAGMYRIQQSRGVLVACIRRPLVI